MDPYIVLSLVIAIVAIFIAIIFKSTRLTSKTNNINSTIERLEASQAELAGRLGQFVEIDSVNHQNLSERMHKQEIEITKMLDARLADVTKHVGESLHSVFHHAIKHLAIKDGIAFEAFPSFGTLARVTDLLSIEVVACVANFLQVDLHLDEHLLSNHRGQESVERLLGAAVGEFCHVGQCVHHGTG